MMKIRREDTKMIIPTEVRVTETETEDTARHTVVLRKVMTIIHITEKDRDTTVTEV